jgi:phosphatidate cytidylyltransferase
VLWPRVLTALAGIPVALLLVYAGGWYLAGAVALLALVGMSEFYRLMTAARERSCRDLRDNASPGGPDASRHGIPALYRWGDRAFRLSGYAFAVWLPSLCLVTRWSIILEVHLAVAVVASGLVALFALPVRPRPSYQLTVVATGLGALCLPALFSYPVLIRALEGESASLSSLPVSIEAGAVWLLLTLMTCWATDVAAYATGKRWGHRKLWPAVSPGKTIEGAIGGLVAALAVTAAIGHWCGLTVQHSLALGALLGVGGQVGDLCESGLKRWAGVKDSGAVLPGHGGVLDRFDSLLFAGPLAYYYLRFAVGV